MDGQILVVNPQRPRMLGALGLLMVFLLFLGKGTRGMERDSVSRATLRIGPAARIFAPARRANRRAQPRSGQRSVAWSGQHSRQGQRLQDLAKEPLSTWT